ncbi:MAG: hypothetical protein QOI36_5251 [Pseudonocardiales bacterium]|jgi:hypothetical protein|nr:rane protein [Pseudonocardia sp.]MDT7653845.1 hypothetical protein [Pseudonocardiales bacterium]
MSTSPQATPGNTTGYGDAAGRSAVETSPWKSGFVVFAGTIMIVAGVFQALAGLVALFRNEVYVIGLNYVFSFDVTTWGWIHLIIGIVVAVAGAAVLTGQLWGRIAGVGIAAVSMLTNFMFIPYYPVWSLLIIALDVFVIWALCTYTRDRSEVAAR